MLHADEPKIEALPRQAQLWSHGARMNGAAKPTVNGVCLYFTFLFSIPEAKIKRKNFPQAPRFIMEIHSASGQCLHITSPSSGHKLHVQSS